VEGIGKLSLLFAFGMEGLEFASLLVQKICIFPRRPRPALRPTLPPRGCDVERSPLHGVEVKMSRANPLIIVFIHTNREMARHIDR